MVITLTVAAVGSAISAAFGYVVKHVKDYIAQHPKLVALEAKLVEYEKSTVTEVKLLVADVREHLGL